MPARRRRRREAGGPLSCISLFITILTATCRLVLSRLQININKALQKYHERREPPKRPDTVTTRAGEVTQADREHLPESKMVSTLALLVCVLPVLIGGLRFRPNHSAARVLILAKAEEELGEDASYDKQVQRQRQNVIEMKEVIKMQNITMTKTRERVEDKDVVFDMGVDFSDYFDSADTGDVRGSYDAIQKLRGSYDAIQKLNADIVKREAESMKQAEEYAKLTFGIAHMQKVVNSKNSNSASANGITRLFAKLDEAPPNFDGLSCPVCKSPVDKDELDNLGKCNICRGEELRKELTKTSPSAKNKLMPRSSLSTSAPSSSTMKSNNGSLPSSSREKIEEVIDMNDILPDLVKSIGKGGGVSLDEIHELDAGIAKAESMRNADKKSSSVPSPSSSASYSSPNRDGVARTNSHKAMAREKKHDPTEGLQREGKNAMTKKGTDFPSYNGMNDDDTDEDEDEYEDDVTVWEKVRYLKNDVRYLKYEVERLREKVTEVLEYKDEHMPKLERLERLLSRLEATKRQKPNMPF